MSPQISVVISVYNVELFIEKTIQSFLDQTFKNFELIIIDDGSTDNTWSILESCAKLDSRIVLLRNEQNMKKVYSLNKVLPLVKGKYIVHSDGDDISLPERLDKQFTFMETHPEIGICGTWMKTTGLEEDVICWYPTDDETIRCTLLFSNMGVVAHGTSIIRRSAFPETKLWYNPDYEYAEDYDLWVRLAKYVKFANIPEIHYLYHQHPQQMSDKHQKEQVLTTIKILEDQLKALGINPTQEEIRLHFAIDHLFDPISMKEQKITKNFLDKVKIWLENLQRLNHIQGIYPEPKFSELIEKRWQYLQSKCVD